MAENSVWAGKGFAAVMAIIACVLWGGSAFPVLKITYAELNLAPGDSAARLVLAGLRFFHCFRFFCLQFSNSGCGGRLRSKGTGGGTYYYWAWLKPVYSIISFITAWPIRAA